MVKGCYLSRKFLVFFSWLLLYDQQNILHGNAPKQKITKDVQQEQQLLAIFVKLIFVSWCHSETKATLISWVPNCHVLQRWNCAVSRHMQWCSGSSGQHVSSSGHTQLLWAQLSWCEDAVSAWIISWPQPLVTLWDTGTQQLEAWPLQGVSRLVRIFSRSVPAPHAASSGSAVSEGVKKRWLWPKTMQGSFFLLSVYISTFLLF